MSYRKMNVNGTKYLYVIGNTAVKIKTSTGSKIFHNKDIFTRDFNREIVTPAMVRDLILSGKLRTPDKYFSSCDCKAPKYIGCLPFEVEIYGKYHYVYFCEDCFNINAGDI